MFVGIKRQVVCVHSYAVEKSAEKRRAETGRNPESSKREAVPTTKHQRQTLT